MGLKCITCLKHPLFDHSLSEAYICNLRNYTISMRRSLCINTLCIHISLAINVLIMTDYLVILYPNYSVVQTICTTTIQVSQEEHDQDKAGDTIGEPYPQLGL